MNNELNTANNGNDMFSTLFAVGLIVVFWLIWLGLTRLINHFFWNYFWWRIISIYLFSVVNITEYKLIWKRYG